MIENSVCNGLFGKTRQSVLALLYGWPDTAFYTRQILDAVQSGHGTVQRELKHLTDAGIIIREAQGQQVYYRANEKCPIFPELKIIVRKTFGIADVIRESLNPIAANIRAAFIFGSIASSNDKQSSDVDIIIIGDVSFTEVSSAISPAEKIIKREINPVVYPADEFRQKVQTKQHFIQTVLSGNKIFLIGDEDEFRKLAE